MCIVDEYSIPILLLILGFIHKEESVVLINNKKVQKESEIWVSFSHLCWRIGPWQHTPLILGISRNYWGQMGVAGINGGVAGINGG